MKLNDYEKRNYVLNDERDLVILGKIKEIERYDIKKEEKEIIKLIRTQLKSDWRTPLIKYLDKLIVKYKK